MGSDRPASVPSPLRLLAVAGLAALATITLVPLGATRMWSAPWRWFQAAAILAPVAALALRLLAEQPLCLPAPRWLAATAGIALVPLASALASPFRGPALLLAAGPFAAAALFLVLADWRLRAGDAARVALERALVAGSALVTLAAFGLWARDLPDVPAAERFSALLFARRNPHPLGHANYTAGLMILALPWLVRAAWTTRGARRAAAGGLALLAVVNLFVSGSRGGLLGLVALAVAALAVSGLGWRRFLGWTATAALVVGVIAVANPRVRDLLRPPAPDAVPNVSNVQRAAMARAGVLLAQERPLLGWGPGSVPLAYPRLRAQLDGGADTVLQLHSLPLQVAAETGLAGLAAAAGAACVLAASWRRHPAAAATLAGYAAFALTDYQLDVPVFAAALAVLAVLLVSGDAAPAPILPRRLVAGLFVAGLAPLALLARRDPCPALNAAALAAGRDPAQRARAIKLLDESLTLNPYQEIAQFNLGWLQVVDRPAVAERHFLAAARLVPDKGGVYFGIALARLNQGRRAEAARALALECINDPLFLASPWWTVPEIAALRDAARREYTALLARAYPVANSLVTWPERQVGPLLALAPRLGEVSPGPEHNYRRQRLGYPVLVRNTDLEAPFDLYDVREDPRFPASVPFPLPSKGWLPAPRMLNLLDQPAPATP